MENNNSPRIIKEEYEHENDAEEDIKIVKIEETINIGQVQNSLDCINTKNNISFNNTVYS